MFRGGGKGTDLCFNQKVSEYVFDRPSFTDIIMLGVKWGLPHAILRTPCAMLGMRCAMMRLQFFVKDECFNIHIVFIVFDIRMKIMHIAYSK